MSINRMAAMMGALALSAPAPHWCEAANDRGKPSKAKKDRRKIKAARKQRRTQRKK